MNVGELLRGGLCGFDLLRDYGLLLWGEGR